MNTPLLILNQTSPIPPYEQINSQIRTLIASMQLLPGTLLPSVRQLARDLGVAPNTIVRAYNELEQGGWVIPVARRGVIVAEHPPTMPSEERRQRLTQAVSEMLIATHQLGIPVDEVYAEIERQTDAKPVRR
ncbi:MAG: GntR family transcriptional regulator [Ktedonobacteraceae bacterium]